MIVEFSGCESGALVGDVGGFGGYGDGAASHAVSSAGDVVAAVVLYYFFQ